MTVRHHISDWKSLITSIYEFQTSSHGDLQRMMLHQREKESAKADGPMMKLLKRPSYQECRLWFLQTYQRTKNSSISVSVDTRLFSANFHKNCHLILFQNLAGSHLDTKCSFQKVRDHLLQKCAYVVR